MSTTIQDSLSNTVADFIWILLTHILDDPGNEEEEEEEGVLFIHLFTNRCAEWRRVLTVPV